MKKIELHIPTNVPITITINVKMSNYSEVKLYRTLKDGKPVIIPGKAWYIYYYFRNPITNKMDKQQDSCKINRFKTVKERTAAGKAWVKAYIILLENGFNPFTKDGIDKKKKLGFSENPDAVEIDKFSQKYNVEEAINYALLNKKGGNKDSTNDDYKTRAGVFVQWLTDNEIHTLDIKELKEVHTIAFFNWLVSPDGRSVGGTSQDNYKRTLSALFGKLYKDKIIDENIIKFETKKDDPEKNTPFTGYEVLELKKYLLENDKQLYDFILFVIYEFLRPVEIVRLKVEDINYREKYLKVETKTSSKNKQKQKKLIGPILNFFERININSLPSEAHIFTNSGNFEVWNAKEKSKVDHFAYRFRKVKKHFGYNEDYGIYSFRHTAALDLYHTFTKSGLTHTEAVSKLMPIIGHNNETTTENYLRDVGALLPKDYGEFYTLDF